MSVPASSRKLAALRVMIVDDSAHIRRTLCELIEAEPDLVVVGKAADGEEALKEAVQIRPDVICLDIEMPRMNGFTFLRLLMSTRPTPVIVVSSSPRKADVFTALELGALDFIAKPDTLGNRLAEIKDELLAKIRSVRGLHIDPLRDRAARAELTRAPEAIHVQMPMRLAVIGASTGGPPVITRLLAALPGDLPLAVAVAQHMPDRFTRAFAERVGRGSAFSVSEAEDGDVLAPGVALVAPGGRHMLIHRDGDKLRASIIARDAMTARYCPSIDLLFDSAARAMGPLAMGVVLTGMGNDGKQGIKAVKAAGGSTMAESEQSAVVNGMPKEAIDTGKVDEVRDLEGIIDGILRFCRPRP